ncbi:hypothetical protein KAH94_06210, partial [bacterium]|nr:hypothetical protein [bacterium]
NQLLISKEYKKREKTKNRLLVFLSKMFKKDDVELKMKISENPEKTWKCGDVDYQFKMEKEK